MLPLRSRTICTQRQKFGSNCKSKRRKVKTDLGDASVQTLARRALNAEGGDITWNRNTNAAHNILRARFDTERPSRLRSERARQIEDQNQDNGEGEEEQTEIITQNISTSGDIISEPVEVDTKSTYT